MNNNEGKGELEAGKVDCNETLEIENIEVDLILEAIWRRFGYDFRNYSKNSLTRRLNTMIQDIDEKKLSGLIPKILYEKNFLPTILHHLTIQVSEMFRDPLFYKSLRENVIPILKTWPIIRIWCAGCATGEEAYSLAIVLQEEGVYQRCLIYATDVNEEGLRQAIEGIYPIKKMREYSENYHKSDGKGSLNDYFSANYGSAIMDQSLKKNIVFSTHNLVSDSVFTEASMIFCRNVMIYFNQKLKDSVMDTFAESLSAGGFLSLGSKENLIGCRAKERFSEFDPKNKIFRKKFGEVTNG
ncbi:MAG: protein-glutamate O-methyltransferase CheR [Candidatus Riflebacteria bacterium]|nr:protein-glutamate O-methyltransferase CheR [Candidatus Riflebacteria bacterium]